MGFRHKESHHNTANDASRDDNNSQRQGLYEEYGR